MLFHSLDYFIFLAIAVLGYWLLHSQPMSRLVFLFGASCAFYMAWHPAYIVLILGSAVLDYTAGLRIHRSNNPRVRKAWLIASLCGNLGLLGVFKYYNFFVQAAGDTAGLLGMDVRLPLLNVLLPVGISFYTFQTLSYSIDIYRRKIEPTRNFFRFAVFVTYFPQLVAGPIVRASEFLPQLSCRLSVSSEQISRGLFWILVGLVKKVAVADYLSVNLVDRVFDNPELFTSSEVVVALYAFTMQIYCDFSGYTDVARGSALLMGIRLPENFDRPYQATNPAEFWRRWHMTLSSWLRDYLYFPLGGSRRGPIRAYFNLWLTMFLIGLWHGASWTFVWYGLLQAGAMVLHRAAYRASKRTKDAVDPWSVRVSKVFFCLQFVVFSRILFRATSVDNAVDVTSRIFSGTSSVAQVSAGVWALLAVSFIAHYVPRQVIGSMETSFVRLPAPLQAATLATGAAILSMIATSAAVPYIYFQF